MSQLKPQGKDREKYFSTEHLSADLKRRSVRGGAVTIMAQVSKLVLQFGSTPILSRLLTPSEYGLLALTGTLTGFISIFKDLGLSQATIQRPEINHDQVNALFWINVAVSGAIALLTVALAPLLAKFYSDPRLIGITVALSLSFLIGGLGVQHQALLQRQMELKILAIIDVLSMIIAIIVGIIAAQLGGSYWSLVLMRLVGLLTLTTGYWSVCNWRPSWPKWGAGVLGMLAFGGNLTGFNVLNYFTRNLDNILIGFYQGPQALGLYDKAYQLLLLPISQINAPMTNVAVPMLSMLQKEPSRYVSYYTKTLLLLATLGMPLVAFLAVDADQIVLLLLGDKWRETTNIFRALAPAAFVGTINVATGWVYLSMGTTDRMFRWSIGTSAVAVTCFLVGIHWGALGVALGFSVYSVGTRYFEFLYCFKGTPVRVRDLLDALWQPAFASLGAGVVLYLIENYFKFWPNVISFATSLLIKILINCLIYGIAYLGIWLLLPRGKDTLLSILNLVKELGKKRGGGNQS